MRRRLISDAFPPRPHACLANRKLLSGLPAFRTSNPERRNSNDSSVPKTPCRKTHISTLPLVVVCFCSNLPRSDLGALFCFLSRSACSAASKSLVWEMDMCEIRHHAIFFGFLPAESGLVCVLGLCSSCRCFLETGSLLKNVALEQYYGVL